MPLARTAIGASLAATLTCTSLSIPARAQAADCHALAASPGDANHPAGKVGVAFEKINFAAAIPACRKALAENPGDPRLSFQLARALDAGKGDPLEFIALYSAAAQAGFRDAMINLGTIFYSGIGVMRDDPLALKWYQRAADLGDADAMAMVGYMHEEGRGVARSTTEAARWYQKAAEAGSVEAMTYHAYDLRNGRGAARNDAEAVKWFRKAADLGEVSAMANLGNMIATGRGVARNDVEAVGWYRKAAEAGNGYAMNGLGYMLSVGRGVPKNRDEAIHWFRKGAAAGDKGAKQNLANLTQRGGRAVQRSGGTSGGRRSSDDAGVNRFADTMRRAAEDRGRCFARYGYGTDQYSGC